MTMSSKRWMSWASGSTKGRSDTAISCAIEIGNVDVVVALVGWVNGGAVLVVLAFTWVPAVSKERARRSLLALCFSDEAGGDLFIPGWGVLGTLGEPVALRASGTCMTWSLLCVS